MGKNADERDVLKKDLAVDAGEAEHRNLLSSGYGIGVFHIYCNGAFKAFSEVAAGRTTQSLLGDYRGEYGLRGNERAITSHDAHFIQ